uniref:Uncharacterized protein n=1 Tax=Anguilla anguilla TaxID=7936 RepID=A0A0E9ULK5_ANGAN
MMNHFSDTADITWLNQKQRQQNMNILFWPAFALLVF